MSEAPTSSATRGTLEVLELSTERALEEYIDLYLPLPIAPSRLGPIAAIFDYVATAAPGVREILTIGKIAYEVREGAWDVVVVDGPATGHCVELLAAPETLNELVGFGPLVDQTGWIEALLADPAVTGVVAVTLAEELPVSETLGLLDRLLTETSVDIAGLVVNQVPPVLGSASSAAAKRLIKGGGPLAEAARVAATRSTVAGHQFERLESLDLPTIDVAISPEPVDEAIASLEARR